MTKTLFVSGHAGAREWAARRGIDAQMVRHLQTSEVEPGDTVIGSLPAHLAAEVCARGARYCHLAMELGPEDRRRELSADDMERLGARLVDIRAEIIRETKR
ncbi:CRISPR-associated protein Csx16 [Pyruvatibacter mobilis]|uniref:CRISPR-associated protein Csx16 n=1 Tax=Pyruvatibacter mobilis TaxID=1712261 RepID=UPI003C7DFF03